MITLQTLILPEPSICTELSLYVQTDGATGFSQSRQELWAGAGGKLGFNSYFNLFSLVIIVLIVNIDGSLVSALV